MHIFALSCLLFAPAALPQNNFFKGFCVTTLVFCGICTLFELHNLYSLSCNEIPNSLWKQYKEKYPEYAAKNMEKFNTATCYIGNFIQKNPHLKSTLNNWLEAIKEGATLDAFNFDKFNMWSKKEIDQMIITVPYRITDNNIRYPYTTISGSTSETDGKMVRRNLRNLIYYYPPNPAKYMQTHYLMKQFKQKYAYKKVITDLAIVGLGSIFCCGMLTSDLI